MDTAIFAGIYQYSFNKSEPPSLGTALNLRGV
jgi:hypothetical protein